MRTIRPCVPLTILLGCAAALPLVGMGCNAVPYGQYRQAQMQSLHLQRQNRALAANLQQTQQMAAQLQAERQQYELAASQLNGNLQIANQRLNNLNQERGLLHEKYKGLLTGFPTGGPSLSGSASERLRALSQRYPEFEYDPVLGVTRFHGNLLFASGSDALRPESHRLLQEFTQILNSSDARDFKILVVGHTDDRPVVKDVTKQRHGTNWDLSAHRATAVVKQLAKFGLEEPRMGIAGYSMFQPADSNVSDSSRQQNRRVEIFILAPDAAIASSDRFPR